MPSAFYRIHDANIHAMHAPGGPVYNLIDEVTMAASTVAKGYVGKRTRKLMGTIRGNHPKQEGGFSIAGLLFANAKHALWHHEGTPHIFPKKGTYLTVPMMHKKSTVAGGQLRREWMAGGARGAKPYFLATSISGQKGNPYLKDAIDDVMARDTRLSYTGI
jgi:hypothetical protein